MDFPLFRLTLTTSCLGKHTVYTYWIGWIQFSSIQSLSRVQFFATPWTAAHQASLSITSSGSLPKLMSIESVMPSNHLILCRPLLLLPSIFPSFRVFSNESAVHIRWSKYWSFSFNISPSNEHPGLISSRMDCFIYIQFWHWIISFRMPTDIIWCNGGTGSTSFKQFQSNVNKINNSSKKWVKVLVVIDILLGESYLIFWVFLSFGKIKINHHWGF